jgi:hypothetical protein
MKDNKNPSSNSWKISLLPLRTVYALPLKNSLNTSAIPSSNLNIFTHQTQKLKKANPFGNFPNVSLKKLFPLASQTSAKEHL